MSIWKSFLRVKNAPFICSLGENEPFFNEAMVSRERYDEGLTTARRTLFRNLVIALLVVILVCVLRAEDGLLMYIASKVSQAQAFKITIGVFIAATVLHLATYVRGALALDAELMTRSYSFEGAQLAARVINSLRFFVLLQVCAVILFLYFGIESRATVPTSAPWDSATMFVVAGLGIAAARLQDHVWDFLFLGGLLESKPQFKGANVKAMAMQALWVPRLAKNNQESI